MKEYVVKTKQGNIKFNFPTSIEEISDEYLKSITNHIKIADHYTLVGLVYHERLANVILTIRNNKKKATIGVNSIFIKAGNTDCELIKDAKIKQKLLITSSQLALGVKVATPNKLNLDYFGSCVIESIEKDLYEREVKNEDQSQVMFLDFKLVPNCDILAVYEDDPKTLDSDLVSVVEGDI